MSQQQNPISRGYAWIIAAFNAWQPLGQVVKLTGYNLDNMQRPNYLPRPDNASQPNDRPELRVEEGRIIPDFHRNSRGVFFSVVYPIRIATANYGPDKLNLVYIVMLQSLEAFDTVSIKDILTDWNPLGGSVRQADPRSNRPEWSGVCDVTMTLSMTRADFLAATFT